MGFVDPLTVDEVVDAESYTRYVCQTVGSPWSYKDVVIMKKKVRVFFEAYPHCTYSTLVHVAHWARAKKKRPAHAYYLVDMARYAWQDGALPEMDPANVRSDVDDLIHQALEQETDPAWRRRLMTAEGAGKRMVYENWTKKSLTPGPTGRLKGPERPNVSLSGA